jgi:hypothetical protein
MIVRKVRGEERIHPVKMTKAQADLCRRLGIPLEVYVKQYLDMIAKQRRWTWYFKKAKQK